jgi:hypothetical protein
MAIFSPTGKAGTVRVRSTGSTVDGLPSRVGVDVGALIILSTAVTGGRSAGELGRASQKKLKVHSNIPAATTSDPNKTQGVTRVERTETTFLISRIALP